MCMLKLSSLMAVIPIAILLTISFFVLLAIRTIEEKGLKAFGYLAVSFLWLATLVVFSGAVYRMAKGSDFAMKRMMQQKMEMMRQDKMQGMAGFEKGAVVKNEKNPGKPKCAGNKGVIFKAE